MPINKSFPSNSMNICGFETSIFIYDTFARQTPNGLRYLRVGGRGFYLGAGKARSEKNA
jgi:hypothetical protein